MITAGWCTLRPWAPPDTAFVYDACQDAEIQRWTTVPRPYRAGDAATFVRQHACEQPEPGGAWFAITATDTGELLGSISVHDVDHATARGEIGYWVAVEARGRGVASSALDGLARWSRDGLGLVEVEVRIATGNLASQRVAASAGFVPVGRQPGACRDGEQLQDALVLARPAG